MPTEDIKRERRGRRRFGIQRELRYKLVQGQTVVAAGTGHTINMGSGGIEFSAENEVRPGTFVELSISWPALLDETCPMRLVVFGRVVRGAGHKAVCTVKKYEFRTARANQSDMKVRTDSGLERWAGSFSAAGA